jgi:hypothetical protein
VLNRILFLGPPQDLQESLSSINCDVGLQQNMTQHDWLKSSSPKENVTFTISSIMLNLMSWSPTILSFYSMIC